MPVPFTLALSHFALSHCSSMFVLAHNSSRAFGGGEIGTVLLLAGLQRPGHRGPAGLRARPSAPPPPPPPRHPRPPPRPAPSGIPPGVQRIGGDAMLPDAARLAARL